MPLTQIQLDVLTLVRNSKNILILPSAPIDADSLGSSLSLYLVLQKLNKKVTVVAADAVPASYNFLPAINTISAELNYIRDFIITIDCRETPPENVRQEIQGNKVNIIVTPHKGALNKDFVSFSDGPFPFDLIITVDAADPLQFGKVYETFPEILHLAPVVNIDHHVSNKGFGKINYVDVMAPATTTMILPLIEELSSEKPLMDADIATLLLAGLITDTGSFQNANTTPDAFSLAAKLIGYGARQQEIIRNIYKTKKLSTLRLWGRTLTKIQYDEKHKLVWSVLTAKDFAEIGSSPDETEGVIDELMSNAPNSEIVFLLKEKGPQEVSGSIRTLTATIDSSKLAGIFGGGGHVQAAGFKIHGKTILEAEQMVVEGLRNSQKVRLGLADAPVTVVTPAAQAPTPVAAPIAAPSSIPVTFSAPAAPAPVVAQPLPPLPPLTPPPAPMPVMPTPPAPAAPVIPAMPSPTLSSIPPFMSTAPAMPAAPQVPLPPLTSAPMAPVAPMQPLPPLPPAPAPVVPPAAPVAYPTPPGIG